MSDPERYYELALRMAMWGDSREKVLKRLRVNGLSDSQAVTLCQRVFGERIRSLRRVYLPKMLWGGLLLLICGVILFVGFVLSEGFAVVSSRALMIPGVLFAWGVVQFGRGMSGWMSAPHREGPVADFE